MIYGIGLPRTGTTTLAEALRLLRLRGYSYCGLTKQARDDKVEEFVVDNTIANFVDLLYSQAKYSKYILTTRDDAGWLESVNNMGTWRGTFTPSTYEKHVREIIPEHNLLVVNWKNCDGWAELCTFLKLPIPDYAFPCENC